MRISDWSSDVCSSDRAELAFVLRDDLPARDAGYSTAEVLAAVEGVAAAIEVVDPRLVDWPKIPPLAAFADFQANGATVVSAVGRPAQGLKVEDLTVDFRMGGLVKAVPGTSYPGEIGKHTSEPPSLMR